MSQDFPNECCIKTDSMLLKWNSRSVNLNKEFEFIMSSFKDHDKIMNLVDKRLKEK
jgi:hypothetical protein